jgi:hypothetical protein
MNRKDRYGKNIGEGEWEGGRERERRKLAANKKKRDEEKRKKRKTNGKCVRVPKLGGKNISAQISVQNSERENEGKRGGRHVKGGKEYGKGE